MAEQGSGGNVIAAICNIFFPGLGQLVQGRLMAAIAFFLAWVITLVRVRAFLTIKLLVLFDSFSFRCYYLILETAFIWQFSLGQHLQRV